MSSVLGSRMRLGGLDRGAIAAVTAAVGFVVAAVLAADGDVVFVGRLAVAGLGVGAVAALSGVGLVLTYRATGIFNFAQGAIAAFVAYLLWQAVVGWGLPLLVAAPLVLGICGPGLGVVAERVVFRTLERRRASTSEKLVATLGLFVLLLGLTVIIWGFGTRTDAPSLFGTGSFGSGRFVISHATVAQLLIVGLASAGLSLLLRLTPMGLSIRAVVDRRGLAELAAINANRVAAIAWAIGFGFAGLVGVLYAPQGLNPYGLTLLVVETFVVAVIARLRHLPAAVAGGLALGVVQSVSTVFDATWLDPLRVNLLVLALLAFLLLGPAVAEAGDAGGTGGGLVTGRMGQEAATGRSALVPAGLLMALAALPLVVTGDPLRDAQRVVALAVVFLSVVAITGFSGHISLGQAGFAGLGAFLTGKIHGGDAWLLPALPVLPSMLVAALLVVPVGVAVGYPALRRRGLALGLVTLAFGLLAYRLVFTRDAFLTGLLVERPSLGPVALDGDRAFFWFCLCWLALALLLTHNVRSGALGRALAAMRDSEAGAASIGVRLRRLKLFIFAGSAFLAALGGSLLAQQARTFDPQQYDPLIGLFWFTAVVVAGLSHLSGALLGAVLFVLLDSFTGVEGASTFLIGVLALLIGRLPGGIVGTLLRRRQAAAAPTSAQPPPPAPPPADLREHPHGQLGPTPLARSVLTGSRQ